MTAQTLEPQRTALLATIEQRFRQLFGNSRDGYPIPAVERHRLEGLMQAGPLLGLAGRAELEALMERVHLEVFGCSIAERRESQPLRWEAGSIDYSGYETPAIERRGSSKPTPR